jgi:hypothetical protein
MADPDLKMVEVRGSAGGIEAWPDQKGGVWRWSAYDGASRRWGTATSEESALAQARRALDDLRRVGARYG